MYTLDNAIELNKEFPDTFSIPSKDKFAKLEIGDVVKLIFREDTAVERMWVQISELPIEKDGILNFTGILDNKPYELLTVKCGDMVDFTQENIIEIYG